MVLNGALLSRHTDINCRARETNGREASHRYMVHTETVWSLKNKKIRKKYTHILITHLALAQTLVCNYGAHNIRKMSTSNNPISPMDAVYLCMRPYDKKKMGAVRPCPTILPKFMSAVRPCHLTVKYMRAVRAFFDIAYVYNTTLCFILNICYGCIAAWPPPNQILTHEQRYRNRLPWLTQGLKNAIKHKNKLYKISMKYDTSFNKITYTQYKNKLTTKLRKTEKEYYKCLLETNKNNLKKTWSIIRSVINNCKPSKLNESFLYNNSVITDKNEVSNKFNDYFVNVGKTLAAQIPKSGPSFHKYLPEANKECIFLIPTDEREIRHIILNIRNSAPGYDGISLKCIYPVIDTLVTPLACITNLSLIEGIFPSELKSHRFYHCIKTMIPCSLIITGQYHSSHSFQFFLKDSCITDWLTSLKNNIFFTNFSLAFVRIIPPSWHWLFYWRKLLKP